MAEEAFLVKARQELQLQNRDGRDRYGVGGPSTECETGREQSGGCFHSMLPPRGASES